MGLNPSPFLTLFAKIYVAYPVRDCICIHNLTYNNLFTFKSSWFKIHIKTPLPGNTSPILPRTVQPHNQDSFLHSIFHNHDNSISSNMIILSSLALSSVWWQCTVDLTAHWSPQLVTDNKLISDVSWSVSPNPNSALLLSTARFYV